MNKIISKNGIVLACFALIITAVVALTHQLTKGAIAQQEKNYLLMLLDEVIPPTSYNNHLADECVLVTAPHALGRTSPQRVFIGRYNNQPVAIAIETTAPNGYNGNIDILIGLNQQNIVTGVRTLRHQETPGLGDKIERAKSTWIDSFKGKALTENNLQQWQVKKDGGEFDQFTGATITPRAVVIATKKAIDYVKTNHSAIVNSPRLCGASS